MPTTRDATRQARADLAAFAALDAQSFYTPELARTLTRWAGRERMRRWHDELSELGARLAGPVDAAVRESNLLQNLPALDRFDGFGERREAVAFHPAWHDAGRAIYGSGLLEELAEPGNNLRFAAMFYLSSHNGEAGHNCAVTCTAGAIKAIAALGSPEIKERTLGRLTSRDWDTLASGAQFLTEVQGGSDVGSNELCAVAAGEPGLWRLHGEKWFCSNVTADVALVTARPEGAAPGTRGLGLFLMPRRLQGGSLNAFAIRRLKDKIGTRTLATAELDFDGALAWQLGPIERGFANVMALVINTSRICNALGCAGIARRAVQVGRAYAERRRAFGEPLIGFPLVQETLADMESDATAMTSGTFAVVHVIDRVERGEASREEAAFARVAVNLNKLRTALTGHEVVAGAFELLGGNGTIETFSVVPRLFRDNLVFEAWEGSHNVLLLQVLRDCRRKGVHEGFFAHLEREAEGAPALTAELRRTRADFAALLHEDDAVATLRLRQVGCRMAYLQWAVAMHQDGAAEAAREHFSARRLGAGVTRDASYVTRLGELARG